jgi:predicted nucleic acid-binding protein
VPFVLDASIAGCWCFHDEHDVRADAAWDLLELKKDRALVPIHWWAELRNIVLQAERRARVTENYSAQFLGRLERFAIDHAPLPDQLAVLALTRRYRLSFYDAIYLELAQRENLMLATLDDQLADAARAESVPLIPSM